MAPPPQKPLSALQKALLKKRLQGKLLQNTLHKQSGTEPIPKCPRDGRLPLSFAQQRLWFLEQLEGEHAAYNIPFGFRLKGEFQSSVFERCLNEIVRRHEILRTSFQTVDGQPVKQILPELTVTLAARDLRDAEMQQHESHVREFIRQEAYKPFQLDQCPLFCLHLFHTQAAEHLFVMTIHHIIYDGWSIGVFMQELSALYNAFVQDAPSPLPELPIQYADFAYWQRDRMKGKTLEQELEYWRQQLAGPLPTLDLPLDFARSPQQTFSGAHYRFQLSAELSANLKAVCRQQKCSLYMLLLAAFKVLLFRYSGQEDMVVGSPIANRTRSELEGLIGFFVNTLVLRTDLSGNPTFRELLARVRKMTLEAHEHQHTPFDMLVAELQPERRLNRQALFQVLFVLQNAPMQIMQFAGIKAEPLVLEEERVKFDLAFELTDATKSISGTIMYNTALFAPETARRMAKHFQTLLQRVVPAFELPISELPILTNEEEQQILVDWNRTHADYATDACLHSLFEQQATRSPESIAVVFQDQRLTYRELDHRANQLARYLIRHGIGPDIPVGVCTQRSLEMVVALLGTLKAGGAYVPIDPGYPGDRVVFMLKDSQAPVLLTQAVVAETLTEQHARIVCLDRDWPIIAGEPADSGGSGVEPGHLAYIMYTSGSTGKPKGVMIPHRAICNHMAWMQHQFPLTPDDRVLQKTPFSFDASVWEFYAPLLTGGTLVMARPGGHQDLDYLFNVMVEHHITIVQFVPSLLRLLLDEGGLERCKALKRLFCGGEALGPDLARRFFAIHPTAQLVNLYGPTEVAIDSVFLQLERDRKYGQNIPIGRPIANIRTYILDQHEHAVPVGVPGELHLGGAGLARGYWQRSELTDEKFIPNPFRGTHPPAPSLGKRWGIESGNGKLYKTGDLARYLPDGNIEFLGRIDHQVKIRGFRIELGEIEALLNAYPAIRENVVVAQPDDSGSRRLVAYFTQHVGEKAAVSDLRDYLSCELPDYMVPSAFVLLDELPLTPNGKVDRRALPEADFSASDMPDAFIAPRTETERRIAEIWANVIGREQVGIHENFFEIGGHSLLAMQVVSQLSKALDRAVSVKDLFLNPTIAELSNVVPDILTGDVTTTSHVESPPSATCEVGVQLYQLEQRPLLSLFTTKALAPVDAVALDYLTEDLLARTTLNAEDLIENWCQHVPTVYNISETLWGRIAFILLPLFDNDLFNRKEALIQYTLDALEIGKLLGARTMTLTGLLPGATNYGRDVLTAIDKRTDLPAISTGHAVIASAYILNMTKILEAGGRKLSEEAVAFLDVSSLGLTVLRLMLKALPHPVKILLCDLYNRLDRLEEIRQELLVELNFQGHVDIVGLHPEIPSELYKTTTLLVCPTGVPDILDVNRVQAGVISIGASCFDKAALHTRVENQQDLLFTFGGVLQLPQPTKELAYCPPSLRQHLDSRLLEVFNSKSSPHDMPACALSSLLAACFDNVVPTVGIVDSDTAFRQYGIVKHLGCQGAILHSGDYVLPQSVIRNFRQCFASETS